MVFLEKHGINIKDKDLLLRAVTHSSYANEEHVEDYERLEFLGDAVLEIVISEYYYKETDMDEGDMTKARAAYVCEAALAEYSRVLDILPFVRVGQGQLKDINDTILADMFESIVGAIYLSNGFNDAKKLIYTIVLPFINNDHIFISDYKSLLQEMIQTSKKSLEYVLVSEEGPAHDKVFVVEVKVENITFGKGTGKSKKEAEQNAAYDAYKKRAN